MGIYRNVPVDEFELQEQDSLRSTAPLYSGLRQRHKTSVSFLQPRLFWKETVDDLKEISWKKSGRVSFWTLSLVVWIGGLIACILALLLAVIPPSDGSTSQQLCGPDGQFRVSPTPYNYLQPSTTFSINIGWGSFSFGDAKLIDVTWDIIIGRGGQGVLGLITYYCFTRALARTMETTTVPHLEFQIVTLPSDSIISLWIHVRHLTRLETVRARLLILWMILSGIFVLAVPTFVGAMSGYSVNVQPFVRPSNATMLSANDFNIVYYTIHDGSRLGPPFHDNYPVFSFNPLDNSAIYPEGGPDFSGCEYCWSYDTKSGDAWDQSRSDQSSDACKISCETSRYAANYGFFGRNQTESALIYNNQTINLPLPALNISAHLPYQAVPMGSDQYNEAVTVLNRSSPMEVPYGALWVDPETGHRPFLENPNVKIQSATGNTSFSLQEFTDTGICIAKSDPGLTYQWGFSALLTLWFLCLLLVWSIGMYAVYMDVFINSRLEANGRSIGPTRAILDLHAAMSHRFEGKATDMLRENELRQLANGVRMGYQSLTLQPLLRRSRRNQIRSWWSAFDVKQWALDEKIWLVIAAVFALVWILSLTLGSMDTRWAYILWIPVFASVVVLVLGRLRRSRWIFFWIPTLLFIFLAIAILATPESLDY